MKTTSLRSRLGWDGLGWVGGGGTACFPKKAFGCFFFFMIHIHNILSVLVAFQRVPQPLV